MVKKVMTTNLDSSKACGPGITPVVVPKTYEPEFSYLLPDILPDYLRMLGIGLQLKTTAC